MPQEFGVSAGIKQTGIKNCIQLSNLTRQLWIKTPEEDTREWKDAIDRVTTAQPGENPKLCTKRIHKMQCRYNDTNVHKSFQ